MERRDLDDGDIEGRLGREEDFEGDPDAVVDAALDALGFEATVLEVAPDFCGELWGIRVRPVVLVDEGASVVEVAYKVMLQSCQLFGQGGLQRKPGEGNPTWMWVLFFTLTAQGMISFRFLFWW